MGGEKGESEVVWSLLGLWCIQSRDADFANRFAFILSRCRKPFLLRCQHYTPIIKRSHLTVSHICALRVYLK